MTEQSIYSINTIWLASLRRLDNDAGHVVPPGQLALHVQDLLHLSIDLLQELWWRHRVVFSAQLISTNTLCPAVSQH